MGCDLIDGHYTVCGLTFFGLWRAGVMTTLRNRVIRLAHARPELRAQLLPILKGEPATKQDAKLLKTVSEAEKALDGVRQALRPYAWD